MLTSSLGATGFIAGDLLYLLAKTHPEYAITCLVRTQENADKVRSKYPDVRCVLGSNDSDEVIQSEVEKADLIIRKSGACSAVLMCADTAISTDDIPSITSISTALKKEKTKGFYIHTSGCGMLCYKALPNAERYGKMYDDIDDLEDLLNFPREAIHRDVEEIVVDLAQSNPDLIKVAIVSPPGIYGRGRGPINTHAMVIPFFSQMLLKAGHGFISEPLCGWDHVHVHDLSRLFLILAEAADAGGGKHSGAGRVTTLPTPVTSHGKILCRYWRPRRNSPDTSSRTS